MTFLVSYQQSPISEPAPTMARAAVLVWLVSMTLVSTHLAQGLGVNWGSMASHPLPPSKVVAMLKENGFTKVKLFDAEPSTMDALAGSGLEVMVGIPNDKLEKLAKDYGSAKDWVKENVTSYLYDGGVSIRYVYGFNCTFQLMQCMLICCNFYQSFTRLQICGCWERAILNKLQWELC